MDRRGTKPTITDANLILGLLDAEQFFGGKMPLHRDASVQALTPLAVGKRYRVAGGSQPGTQLLIATEN